MKTNNKELLEAMLSISNFMTQNKKSGQLIKETSDEIQSLWNKYKLSNVAPGTSIIEADFGTLGSLVIRDVESLQFEDDNYPLQYKSGSYDYVSIVSSSTRKILWTDYEDTEPFNRQGGLYCSGASFDQLGLPIKEETFYREFDVVHKYKSNISFAVWGYSYNDFYGSVRFGLVIKTEMVKDFIEALRTIINK